MFTGIVEEMGRVRQVPSRSRAGVMSIAAHAVLEGMRIGDSIAVNGVCLTVVELGVDYFAADVMPETLSKSGLGRLKVGDVVDLERAMAADGRFGGHIVSGHIDGTGTIVEMRSDQNAVWVRIRTTPEVLALIVEKGSIAVDGISLTVVSVSKVDFQVSLIPHTGATTILLGKRVGDMVNLENDIVGKYVQRLLGQAPYGGRASSVCRPISADGGLTQATSAGSGLTREFLVSHGF